MFYANFMAGISNYEQQKNLEVLWGSAWQKLTPKQQELVTEILSTDPKKSSDLAISEGFRCKHENPISKVD
jgi:hypothetical protein